VATLEIPCRNPSIGDTSGSIGPDFQRYRIHQDTVYEYTVYISILHLVFHKLCVSNIEAAARFLSHQLLAAGKLVIRLDDLKRWF
jgi:hypothetical protein